MKKFVLIVSLLVLSGCANDPIQTNRTDNNAVPVDLLFTVDGCKVYRFTDAGKYQYVAICPSRASVRAGHDEIHSAGKTTYVETVYQTIDTVWPDE